MSKPEGCNDKEGPEEGAEELLGDAEGDLDALGAEDTVGAADRLGESVLGGLDGGSDANDEGSEEGAPKS